MKKFGEIFKKFRESRGLRLKDVAKVGISTSQLSRFENGETDLTISKFIAVLDEVNVPIDEFMYAVHDFRRDELNELLLKVNCFVSNHDVEGMKKLLYLQMESNSKRSKFHQINTILIKILRGSLKDPAETLKNAREHVAKLKKHNVLSFPLELVIYPSVYCDLKCGFCFLANREDRSSKPAKDWE